jgi:hypothetical protein
VIRALSVPPKSPQTLYSSQIGPRGQASPFWARKARMIAVLERAGFTREGVVRSLPIPGGRRVDKTLFSLLPDE